MFDEDDYQDEILLEHESRDVQEIDNVQQNSDEANIPLNTDNPESAAIAPVIKKRIVRNPRPKFNGDRLCGKRGIPIIMNHFKDVKFKGKGHETEDLDLLLSNLELWTHRLFPSIKFKDNLKQIEKLGQKNQVKVCIRKIRLDMPILDDDFVREEQENEAVDGDLESNTDMPSEMLFDQLLDNHHLSSDTIRNISASQPENSEDLHLFSSQPVASTITKPVELTEEQRQRMEQNRKIAIEKIRARMSLSSSMTDAASAKDPTPIQAAEIVDKESVLINRDNDKKNMNDNRLDNSAKDPKPTKKLTTDDSHEDDSLTIDELVNDSIYDDDNSNKNDKSKQINTYSDSDDEIGAKKKSSKFPKPAKKVTINDSDEEDDSLDIDELVNDSIYDDNFNKNGKFKQIDTDSDSDDEIEIGTKKSPKFQKPVAKSFVIDDSDDDILGDIAGAEVMFESPRKIHSLKDNEFKHVNKQFNRCEEYASQTKNTRKFRRPVKRLRIEDSDDDATSDDNITSLKEQVECVVNETDDSIKDYELKSKHTQSESDTEVENFSEFQKPVKRLRIGDNNSTTSIALNKHNISDKEATSKQIDDDDFKGEDECFPDNVEEVSSALFETPIDDNNDKLNLDNSKLENYHTCDNEIPLQKRENGSIVVEHSKRILDKELNSEEPPGLSEQLESVSRSETNGNVISDLNASYDSDDGVQEMDLFP